jgi:hypothetical protein
MEKTNLHLEVGIELYLTLDMNIKNWNVISDLGTTFLIRKMKIKYYQICWRCGLEIATQFGKHEFIR